MTENTDKETVIILGGSGLLGYHCYEELASDYNVISTYLSHPLPYAYSVRLDVLDGMSTLIDILAKYRPKAIINTVALVSVDGCEVKPELAQQLNVGFAQMLVEAVKKTGLNKSHIIHISSDSVYGRRAENTTLPWSEQDSTNPLSIYAKTKLMGEQEIRKHSGPFSILRTAFYGINPFSEKSLLYWIINNAKNGNAMDGWENVFFSPVAASSLAQLIKRFISDEIDGLYNVGSIDACNKYDFVDAVCSGLGLNPTINRVTSRVQNDDAIRPEYSVLDTRKLVGVVQWDLQWRGDLNQYLQNMPSFPKSSKLRFD